MKKWIFILIALPPLSCSHHDSAPNAREHLEKLLTEPTTAVGTLTHDRAKAIFYDAANSISDVEIKYDKTPSASMPGAISGSGTSTTIQSCSPTVSGDTSDKDGDGVPVDEIDTYNCPVPGNGFGYSGSIETKDKNDNVAFPQSGYTRIWDGFTVTLSGATVASTSGFTQNEIFDIDVANNVWTVTLQEVVSFFLVGSDGKASPNGSSGYWIHAPHRPTDPANPGSGGSLDVSGHYSNSTPNGPDITLQFSATNLSYGGCKGGYPSGNATVTFQDASGNSLTANFSNCNVTGLFNGSAI